MTDLSDLVAEGRRLHEFARMADAFPQRVTTGADLGVWSRNNLPALLDEAEKVPTLEAEVERLQADRDRCKAAAISIEHDVCHVIGEALYGPDGWGDHVAQTLAQKAVNEIARLREALEAAVLRRIEAENPGIDMERVRTERAAALAVVEEPK